MPNRLDKTVAITQVAAVEFRAAVPARCVTTKEPKSAKSSFGSAGSGGSGSFDYPISHYTPGGDYIPTGDYRTYQYQAGRGGGSGGGGSKTVCYPEITGIAGSPARLIIDLSPGWNGGAQSITALSGDFLFSLLATNSPVGVVVGVSPPYAGAGLNSVEHGFKLSNGKIAIIEGGVEVSTCPILPSAGLRMFIGRYKGRITYAIGGWSYVSPSSSIGNKSATALLYSHGDYVIDPIIAAASNSEMSARGRVGFSFSESANMTARARMGFRSKTSRNKARLGFVGSAAISAGWDLSGRAKMGSRASARLSTNELIITMPPMEVIASDTRRGRVNFTLPALSVDAAGGYALPDIGVGAVSLPTLSLAGLFKVGGVGSGNLSIKPMVMRASNYPTGDGVVTLPRLEVNGASLEYDPEGAFMYEVCQLFHVVLADTIVYARWREQVGVGDQLLISAIVSDSVYEAVIAQGSISATQVMFEIMRDALEISTSSGAIDDIVMQYATNMLTGAATRYEGFGFEGFTADGLDCYGYKANGVYIIEDGAGDNGTAINAAIDFAMAGTDSSFNKRMENLYFGLASDGNVYARVKTEHGQEITYLAVASQSAYRAVCAKGAQSRHWALKLEIVDATYADLDSVEWDIKAMTRRNNQ